MSDMDASLPFTGTPLSLMGAYPPLIGAPIRDVDVPPRTGRRREALSLSPAHPE